MVTSWIRLLLGLHPEPIIVPCNQIAKHAMEMRVVYSSQNIHVAALLQKPQKEAILKLWTTNSWTCFETKYHGQKWKCYDMLRKDLRLAIHTTGRQSHQTVSTFVHYSGFPMTMFLAVLHLSCLCGALTNQQTLLSYYKGGVTDFIIPNSVLGELRHDTAASHSKLWHPLAIGFARLRKLLVVSFWCYGKVACATRITRFYHSIIMPRHCHVMYLVG